MSRRLTRRAAAEAGLSANATLSELYDLSVTLENGGVPPPTRSTIVQPSAASIRATAAAERRTQVLSELRALLESQNVTGPMLKSFMEGKTQKYFWDLGIWIPAVMSWIERGQWGPFYYFMMTMYDIKAPWLQTVLDKMRDSQPDQLFIRSKLWGDMKEELWQKSPSPSWWKNHVIESLSNEPYINKLLTTHWFIDIDWIILNPTTVSENTIDDFVKTQYRIFTTEDHFEKHHSRLLQEIIKDKNSPKSLKLRYMLKSLIANRFTSPPLVVTIVNDVTPRGFSKQQAFDIFNRCVTYQLDDILEAFVPIFSMRRTENQQWLKILFHELSATQIPNSIKRFMSVLDYIVKKYKINLNNVYMDVPNNILEYDQGTRRDRLIRQPHTANQNAIISPFTWISGNIPLIAYAIMMKNKKMVKFLLTLGATPKRCAFSLEDLTTDREMLKLLLVDVNKTASKIQQKYLEYSLAPSHYTQASRQTAWDARLAPQTTPADQPSTSASASAQTTQKSVPSTAKKSSSRKQSSQ